MAEHVLITGGAGFIGSHLADELLNSGYQVRILDNLSEQVHGPLAGPPDYLAPDAELMIGDMRNPEDVKKALQDIDAVFHFAAMVGVGQSMYQVSDYVAVNDLGTANLLQALIRQPVSKLIVASSMSIYGEGLYLDYEGKPVQDARRSLEQLKQGGWELCDKHGAPLIPAPTPESKPAELTSVYALSKYVQERMCLIVGKVYHIPTVALRFFNVYGTRQSLSNPYTGVLAIFASRLLNGHQPQIFEDGRQERDFVHVWDVSRACRLALEIPGAAGLVINVGSGQAYSILSIAEELRTIMGKKTLSPEVTGRYRAGDIRHCFADISRAREVLGFEPLIALEDGLLEMAEWLAGQSAVDRFEQARHELAFWGLTA